MRVELIYDADCPNVAESRANLLQAFAAVRLEAEWTEWERSSPSIPAYVAGFGSPTVLVEGFDVAGDNPREHISCCRLYASVEGRYSGVPSVELLKTSFAPGTLAAASPRHWGRNRSFCGFRFLRLPFERRARRGYGPFALAVCSRRSSFGALFVGVDVLGLRWMGAPSLVLLYGNSRPRPAEASAACFGHGAWQS